MLYKENRPFHGFIAFFFSTSDRGEVRENPSTPLKRAPKKLSKIV